jgi:hypothetical protein
MYHFPQKTAPAVLQPGERGIASLQHPDVGTLRFRSNPKQFNWSYTLNKRIDQTYGGRVVQLLGTRIDDFSFTADCGRGRWDEMNRVAHFMRNVMVKQRNGRPATFEYTTRGWKFNAFVVSVPFADAVEEVLREFEVSMKVQEDLSGLISSNTLAAELRRLQDGIAFRRSRYNDPRFGENQSIGDPEAFDTIANGAARVAAQTAGAAFTVAQNFLPNGLPGFVTPTTTGTGLGGLINSFFNPNPNGNQ